MALNQFFPFLECPQVDGRGAWVAGSLERSMGGGDDTDNIFLVHFDSNGVHQWTVEHGGGDTEECWGLQVETTGAVVCWAWPDSC